MIVMVVTQQHRRDRRQITERHGRLPNSPRTEHIPRTCTLGIHGMSQDVSCRSLNQKRRVTNERDDGGGAVQLWRRLRRLVDTGRPRCSWFEQHPRNGREWLSRSARGIDESPSIEVIAFLSRHRNDCGNSGDMYVSNCITMVTDGRCCDNDALRYCQPPLVARSSLPQK